MDCISILLKSVGAETDPAILQQFRLDWHQAEARRKKGRSFNVVLSVLLLPLIIGPVVELIWKHASWTGADWVLNSLLFSLGVLSEYASLALLKETAYSEEQRRLLAQYGALFDLPAAVPPEEEQPLRPWRVGLGLFGLCVVELLASYFLSGAAWDVPIWCFNLAMLGSAIALASWLGCELLTVRSRCAAVRSISHHSPRLIGDQI